MHNQHNPARSYRFPTFWFGQIKPMGKLNASVGENILFRFRRDENASALSRVFVLFPFSINQVEVENFILIKPTIHEFLSSC